MAHEENRFEKIFRINFNIKLCINSFKRDMLSSGTCKFSKLVGGNKIWNGWDQPT